MSEKKPSFRERFMRSLPKCPEELTRNLAYAVSSAAIGSGFQHGYNTGVINTPQALIQDFINNTYTDRNGNFPTPEYTNILVSIIVAIYSIGGMIGALLSAFTADHFGRKGGLILNNLLVFMAAALQGLSKMAESYEMLIIGRFIIGINSGINAALAPMYLTEISPVSLRGAVGTIYQLVITITILLSQIVGLPAIFGTETRWPFLFDLIAIPAIFMCIAMYFCPDSPKFLLSRGLDEGAEKGLKWFRQTEDVLDEIDEMKREVEDIKNLPKITLKDLCGNEALRKPLIISVVIMIAQQLSGINAVIYFSTTIFQSAGLSKEASVVTTIGMGIVNVLTTVVSLLLVERVGRKTLFLTGMSGMALLSLILTVSLALKDTIDWTMYISVLSIFGFVIMFATGPGSIPWFIVSELFSQNARPLASSIAVGVNWLANFMVGIGFLPLANLLGYYVFLMFTIFLVIFSLFTYLEVPETKGKTIEEITEEFRRKTDTK